MGLRPAWRDVTKLTAAGWTTLAVAFAIVAVAALGEPTELALRFDRDGIGSGEVWRLVSGHFVHLGVSHALLNAAGLLLIMWLVGGEYRLSAWLGIAGISMVVIDAGLWWWVSTLDWYVGLSGVLHGLLAAGVLSQALHRRPDAWLLGAVLVGKLVFEALYGALPGSAATAGGPVVTEAHLLGAAGGVAAGVLAIRFARPASL